MHSFECVSGEYFLDVDLPLSVAHAPTVVLGGISSIDSAHCVSNCVPQKLDEWQLSFVKSSPASSGTRAPTARPPASVDESLIAQYPWLKDYYGGNDGCTPREPIAHIDVSTDVAVEAAWARLEEARALWATEGLREPEAFFLRTRAGVHFGAGAGTEAVWTEASKGAPRMWCTRYSFPQSMHLSCAKFGDVGAMMLAFAWCHRLQFFYDLWRAQNDQDFTYTEADVRSYVEELSFREFARGAIPLSETANKVSLLRMLSPSHRGR